MRDNKAENEGVCEITFANAFCCVGEQLDLSLRADKLGFDTVNQLLLFCLFVIIMPATSPAIEITSPIGSLAKSGQMTLFIAILSAVTDVA